MKEAVWDRLLGGLWHTLDGSAADKVARTIHGMMTGAEGVVQLPNRKRKA